MRVAINVAVVSGQLTGVGYYTLSLVRALARVCDDVEWVLLGADPAVDLIPVRENIQIVGAEGLANGARRAAWQQWALPRLAVRAQAQLLHCPDYSRPVYCPIPVVNTIHDLSFYSSSPAFLAPGDRLWKGALAHLAVKQSARLIAVSEFVRVQILERFRIEPSRVVTVHEAGAELPDQPRESAKEPFLLFVGTLETRKNLITLIDAFISLRASGQIVHRLVLVGKNGWGSEDIRAAIASSPFRHDIEVRGYASREEVLRLYRSTDLFVYPSLYEGFGLPLLEAMTCGAPVVCSRVASLHEVAGDAAEFFDPRNAQDLAAAIQRVLRSPELQQKLRSKGKERVKQFSWDECARRHCAVFRDVLQN